MHIFSIKALKVTKIVLLSFISLLFAIFYFASVQANTNFSGGNGTKESPYEISKIEDFLRISNHLNKHFVLINDLDFESYKKSFTSIGLYNEGDISKVFSGTFNGNGYKIKNLTIKSDGVDNVAIFGAISGQANNQAIIKNLAIQNITVIGKDNVAALIGYAYDNVLIDGIHMTGKNVIKGADSVAGIIGKTEKNITLKDCSSVLTITGEEGLGGIIGFVSKDTIVSNCFTQSQVTGVGHIGGFAGRVYGTIQNSGASSKVIAMGYDHDAAGFAGTLINSGKIIDCYAYGTVEGFANIGGLVGRTLNYYPEGVTPPSPLPTPSVLNSYSVANVKGVSQVGGLIGYIKENTKVDNAYATGDVTVILDEKSPEEIAQGNHGGGLIGKIDTSSKITNSRSFGAVSGEEGLGGLVGYLGEGSTISKSHSVSSVKGIGHIDGLVGRCYGQIDNSYSNNTVVLSGDEHDAGGIAGTLFNKGSIKNCYSTGKVSGHENIGGIVCRAMTYYAEGKAPAKIPNPKVENCTSYADISGDENIGGIVGLAKTNAVLQKNTSFSLLNGKNITTTGTIAGQIESGATLCN